MSEPPKRNFASDEHALLTGATVGLLLKQGLVVEPGIDDDGDYTDIIEMDLPSPFTNGTVRLRVLPPDEDSR